MMDSGKLDALIRHLVGKKKVPLPEAGSGLLGVKEGWQLHAIAGLWAEDANREGDVLLVSPAKRVLHATWDVAADGKRSAEALDDPHLQLALHLTKPIRDWEELKMEVFALLPEVAVVYGAGAAIDR
jgi:hypothetical protein